MIFSIIIKKVTKICLFASIYFLLNLDGKMTLKLKFWGLYFEIFIWQTLRRKKSFDWIQTHWFMNGQSIVDLQIFNSYQVYISFNIEFFFQNLTLTQQIGMDFGTRIFTKKFQLIFFWIRNCTSKGLKSTLGALPSSIRG